MPRSNQNFSNQGSSNFQNMPQGSSVALDGIYEEIEFHQNRIQALEEAASLIEGGEEFTEGMTGNRGNFRGGSNTFGGTVSNSRNRSSRGGSIRGFHTQGTPKNENGTDDRRYRSNRMHDDAEAYGVDDIDWSGIRYNEDQSVDLRTKAGRALLSAGMVDEEGFPTDNFPNEYLPREFASGGRGGRGRSSNR